MAKVLIKVAYPTTRNDGTSVSPDDINRIDLFLSSPPGSTPTKIGTLTSGTKEFTTSDLSPGSYGFLGQAFDKAGVAGDMSDEAAILVPVPNDVPPALAPLGAPVLTVTLAV